jgi:hypothetical protein
MLTECIGEARLRANVLDELVRVKLRADHANSF